MKRQRNSGPTIDWKDVRARLEKAASASAGSSPTLEDERTILRHRARELARQIQAEAAGEKIEVVQFLLGREKYGVEIGHVREVCPLTELTPVPCTPHFVIGVINVRGQILSVIDLKQFFDLPHEGLGDLNKAIIIQSDKMQFGILADVLLGVCSLPVGELQQSLPTLSGVREQYFQGIAGDGTIVLDAEKLLADRRLIVHEEIN